MLSVLWPPNHKLVEIEIGGVTDPDDGPVTPAMPPLSPTVRTLKTESTESRG